MSVVIVIPARFGSSRFPGKPLVRVAGKSVLQRTLEIAQAVRGTSGVYVATDDARIADHTKDLGGSVLMTTADCRTGTDRTAAAIAQLSPKPTAAINLQGDALLTPPWVLQPLVDLLEADPSVAMVTPAVRLDAQRLSELREHKHAQPTSGTTVVVDAKGQALYFSKAIIPYGRNAASAVVRRHIGVYGYRADTLSLLASLPQSSLEQAEGLEQLRALENGIGIRVVDIDYRGRTHWSIDAPEDVSQAEAIIAREGELVS